MAAFAIDRPELPQNENAVYPHQLYLPPPPHRWLHFHMSQELQLLCRCIAWVSLAFLALSCVVLIFWILFHPTFPKLTVASATLSFTAVTPNSTTADCYATLVLMNPNRYLTAVFDRVEIYLYYPAKQVTLSYAEGPLIVQPSRSRIAFVANLSMTGARLEVNEAKALKKDIGGGSISLGVRMFARVRYRNGKLKMVTQYMSAYCAGVSFAFPSLNYTQGLFLNPYQQCEVYLYSK